jgi:legumain
MKYLLLALCFAIALAAPENHWAVLVAGSDGYGNYRHQADVLHAFQIMKRNGIPESNIVVMAYDDIAGNRRNPFPGQVFNKPGSPGVDVYAGATIDYKGRDVSPSNFLNVLSGNAAGVQGGNGKVLHSGPNDHIFIFFSDHGSGGLICFPHKNLYADDLNDTLQSMFEDKKFGKMVIYIETCYSGSMFEGILPPNTNIYATTAANAHESSWGHYCYPDDEINGKHVGSCLGDEYSISWMEDTDASDINTKTLQEQYYSVRDRVQGSHVMQYGDSRYTDSPLVNFQGTGGVRKGLRDRIQM